MFNIEWLVLSLYLNNTSKVYQIVIFGLFCCQWLTTSLAARLIIYVHLLHTFQQVILLGLGIRCLFRFQRLDKNFLLLTSLLLLVVIHFLFPQYPLFLPLNPSIFVVITEALISLLFFFFSCLN
jgi:hypothetical protein